MGRHNDKALEMAVVQGEMRCAHTRWSCLRTQPFLRLWEDVGYDGWYAAQPLETWRRWGGQPRQSPRLTRRIQEANFST
ncbi:predicted protein [Plenodomus lingam JN3]|uniref:Predicted protein n=1 Tax=Leptosphaeria maculans (strain JN3 / isolate v23.1.3 / race Av1-4-5-6-7-8) TaxID=985895 RepID=E5A1W2_LEPMJ|nr:predicted protein [Plenodomus lingam JN3]CBX97679.1 predicted protein [Plenodomus lingam JN3]